MAAPDPAAYEALAAQAYQLKGRLLGLRSGIQGLGSRVQQLLAGTATQEDARMIGIALQAAQRLSRSVYCLDEAYNALKRAADEARRAQAAERERQAQAARK